MPTVAGYARLSIAKDTSVSIAAQHQMLQRWAEVHDRPITLYTDDGYSGSKAIERPAFERMLAGVAATTKRSPVGERVVVEWKG